MGFDEWLTIGLAMGIACLPVMRRWQLTVAGFGESKYSTVWMQSQHFLTNRKEGSTQISW